MKLSKRSEIDRRTFLGMGLGAVALPILGFTGGADALTAERRVRLRELGIVIGDLQPGEHNAITDVVGVKVGHVTLINGEGP